MGKADQIGKTVFAQETAASTQQACRWEVPRELPIGTELLPDGAVRVVDAAALAELAAPWCELRGASALVELKMGGDHIDARAWIRALARRAVWDMAEYEVPWRAERERAAQAGDKPSAVVLAPHADLLFVAPHLPDWIGQHSRLILCTPGIWRVGGPDAHALWIAANDLPLDEALIPFLQVRNGRARIDFAHWMAQRARLPDWFGRWMEALHMTNAELLALLDDDDDRHTQDDDRVLTPDQVRSVLVHFVPELKPALIDLARRQGREEEREEAVDRLFTLRLRRPLTEAESRTLRTRLPKVGVEALEQRVLDSTAEELEAWLAT